MIHGRAYKKLNYTWEITQLSQATIQVRKRKRKNLQEIKQAVDFIKTIMLKERSYAVRKRLALAGIELNNLLVK